MRGALAAGVQFVATYPGTPASEIGILFSQIAPNRDDLYFEFSTNEKLAMEAVIGASFSGLKCLSAMKNFGLNVALEALAPFAYTGSKGPAVIIAADDPSCHSSAQSEENSRGFANITHIPILEPADAQECYDFTRLGFEISEQFKIPVIIRLTTRVAHQRAVVQFKVQSSKFKVNEGKFIKDKNKFLTMPPRVLEQHQELLDKIEAIRKYAEKSDINFIQGRDASLSLRMTNNGKLGIITSGVSYLYVMEAIEMLGLNLPVLKLGFFYPLPAEKIKKFIKPLKQVLIVEELEPFLEKEITGFAKEVNCKLKIFGKNSSSPAVAFLTAVALAKAVAKAGLPEVGELTPGLVAGAIAKILKIKNPFLPSSALADLPKLKHLPRFCSGAVMCPYWQVFAAIKKAIPDQETAVFGGDIGCYMLGALPPHNLYDYMASMGSSIGIGHGISKATQMNQPAFAAASAGKKVITFMGDGTFFHSGIAALLNAVYNQSNILAIILDNRITAMTGHQPNPGERVKIEEVIAALGVKPENLRVIDPVADFAGMVAGVKDFYTKNEVSVIIARRICALLEKKKIDTKCHPEGNPDRVSPKL